MPSASLEAPKDRNRDPRSREVSLSAACQPPDFPRQPMVGRSHLYYAVLRRSTLKGEELSWDEDSAAYIRSRGKRYPNGMDIEPEWTKEVMADEDLVALESDPKSRMGASWFIGHSPSAGRVLVVIAQPRQRRRRARHQRLACDRDGPEGVHGRKRQWPRRLTPT